MSGYSDIDALTAFGFSEYGLGLAPFENDDQRVYSWLAGWRSAPSLENKRTWVQRFEIVAVLALESGLLAHDEFELIFHEVVRMEPMVLPPEMGLPTPATTPDYSPELGLMPAAVSPPKQQPQQKKRRGRPVGSKDVTERARRGTQKSWTRAEKSKNSRENLNKRKAIVAQQEQEQQQQLQTPPPSFALPPPPPFS